MKSLPSRALALVAALCCTPGALALSSDRDQPINIEANQAEADDLRRVTVYRGDVVITQGSLEILGDVVTIHFDENQQMKKLVAQGKPASFKQKPDGNEALQNARARTLEFYADDDTIVLLGDAVSWQGQSRIKAERIVYDTRKGRVRADSASTAGAAQGTGQRVKITIAPKKKQPQE